MTISAQSDGEFYIVDFDRTLVDTDKMTEVFIEIAEEHGAISREQIQKANDDVTRTGDSFDTAGYVRDRLMSEDRGEEWDALEKQYIHESRSLNYLLPGAAELLEWLAAHGKRYGILTYGNPLWQHIKLTASGFNHVRHIILEQKEKGKLIASWQRDAETFRLPEAFGGGWADYIVLIDDKAVSFADLPAAPTRGYWVLDAAHELPSQQGSVPDNVARCQTLQDVIKSL